MLIGIIVFIALVLLIIYVLSANGKNERFPKHFTYWNTEVEALQVEAPIGGFPKGNSSIMINAFLNRKRATIKATEDSLYINGEKVTEWEYMQEKDGTYYFKITQDEYSDNSSSSFIISCTEGTIFIMNNLLGERKEFYFYMGKEMKQQEDFRLSLLKMFVFPKTFSYWENDIEAYVAEYSPESSNILDKHPTKRAVVRATSHGFFIGGQCVIEWDIISTKTLDDESKAYYFAEYGKETPCIVLTADLITYIGEPLSANTTTTFYIGEAKQKFEKYIESPLEEYIPSVNVSIQRKEEICEKEVAQKEDDYSIVNSEEYSNVKTNSGNEQVLVDEEKPQEDRNIQNMDEKSMVSEPLSKSSKKGIHYTWVVTGLLLIVVSLSVGGYFYYKNVYLPAKIDKEAPRYYTFSHLTNMRSSQIVGVDYNKIASLPYGSEVITYSYGTEWSSVKNEDKKGFISSNLLMNKEDFYVLNSIWGDNDSRECIVTSKCRIALLNYFKDKNYIGKISSELLNEIKPGFVISVDNQWQVFCRNKNMKPNTVFYPRLFDKYSKFTDFAVLIKNIQTEDRKVLIFTFSEDETPSLFYESNAPKKGYIKNIRVVKDYFGEEFIKVEYTD